MKLTTLLKAATVSAIALCASNASAATLLIDVAPVRGPAFAQRFDTSLGQLNSVTFLNSYTGIFQTFYPTFLGGPAPSVSGSGQLGGTDIGLAPFSGVFQTYFSALNEVSFRVDGAAMTVFTDNLARFTGPGFVTFAPSGLGTFSFLDGARQGETFTTSAVGSGRFQVIYDFTPAIPEPATWAMMLLGFGMVGASIRYQARKTRVSFATA